MLLSTTNKIDKINIGELRLPYFLYDPGAVFTTSGIFTVPKGVKSIDVFCVGGGSGSGGYHYYRGTYGYAEGGANGGGGGFTKSVFGVEVDEDQQISVTIGAGGVPTNAYNGAAGGDSSINNICSVSGGGYGTPYGKNNSYYINGGSGGGIGRFFADAYSSTTGFNEYSYVNNASTGGEDGADGNACTVTSYTGMYYSKSYYTTYGGKGQGTTTRYFGESSGTLYSTGGNGGIYGGSYRENATANTGNGAKGSNSYDSVVTIGGNGGSGIAIIRWGKK
jgi:hypothetical protein